MNQVVNVDDDEVPEEFKLESKSETEHGVEKSNKRVRKFLMFELFHVKMGKGKDGVKRTTCNGCKRQYKCDGKKIWDLFYDPLSSEVSYEKVS